MHNTKRLVFFFTIMLCTVCTLFAKPQAGRKMYVCSETVDVKERAGSFTKKVGDLYYGEIVVIVDTEGKWVLVESDVSMINGWIPAASLTSKKVKTGSGVANASAKELALAGKGFTQEIEDSYKQSSTELNYDAVDAMEKKSADTSGLYDFMTGGNLMEGE